MEKQNLGPIRQLIEQYGYATTFERISTDTLDTIEKGLVAFRTARSWGGHQEIRMHCFCILHQGVLQEFIGDTRWRK